MHIFPVVILAVIQGITEFLPISSSAHLLIAAEMMNIKPEDLVKEITKDIPLGIIPDDRDCANAVLFLASDLAKVITGANLDVNGGEFMS